MGRAGADFGFGRGRAALHRGRPLPAAVVLAAIVSWGGPAAACTGSDAVFYGTVCYFPYAKGCPSGFLPADGRMMQIRDGKQATQALFSLLGTAYGGDGVTTFALPDLRGRSPIGAGRLGDASYEPGQTLGHESTALRADDLPLHTHSVSTLVAFGELAAVGKPTARQASPAGGSLVSFIPYFGYDYFRDTTIQDLARTGDLAYSADFDVTLSTGQIQVSPNASAGAPISIVPPQVALVACIATEGEFPSRP